MERGVGRFGALAEDGLSGSPVKAATGPSGGTEALPPAFERSQEYLQAIALSTKIKTSQMLRATAPAAPAVSGGRGSWSAQSSIAGSNTNSPGKLSMSTLGVGVAQAAVIHSVESRLHSRIAELELQLSDEVARARELEGFARTKEKQVVPCPTCLAAAPSHWADLEALRRSRTWCK